LADRPNRLKEWYALRTGSWMVADASFAGSDGSNVMLPELKALEMVRMDVALGVRT
jgi:hypothetical protein